jgi:hypothetical protein
MAGGVGFQGEEGRDFGGIGREWLMESCEGWWVPSACRHAAAPAPHRPTAAPLTGTEGRGWCPKAASRLGDAIGAVQAAMAAGTLFFADSSQTDLIVRAAFCLWALALAVAAKGLTRWPAVQACHIGYRGAAGGCGLSWKGGRPCPLPRPASGSQVQRYDVQGVCVCVCVSVGVCVCVVFWDAGR